MQILFVFFCLLDILSVYLLTVPVFLSFLTVVLLLFYLSITTLLSTVCPCSYRNQHAEQCYGHTSSGGGDSGSSTGLV